MIELKKIRVRYHGKIAVDGISATVSSGQFVAIIGPNGSGKSSLLKAIAGIAPHDGKTSLPTEQRARAKQLSYLAQNSTAPAWRKVEDIIALGRTPFLGPIGKLSEVDKKAINMAAKSCETDALFGRQYGTLSGGERMRVHLSRALATQASILLADEPTTALDPYYQISTMNILRKTANSGTTILVALHDLKLAERFADKIWIMNDGNLVANESAKAALTDTILQTIFRVTADGDTIT